MTMIVPDYAGVMRGWRRWRQLASGRHMRSMSAKAYWTPGVRMGSICRIKDFYDDIPPVIEACHDGSTSPGEYCTCGIYATNSFRHLWQQYAPETYSFDGGIIFGVVALWGKIIEYDKGYRAQYAYPEMLVSIPRPMWASKVERREAQLSNFLNRVISFPTHRIRLPEEAAKELHDNYQVPVLLARPVRDPYAYKDVLYDNLTRLAVALRRFNYNYAKVLPHTGKDWDLFVD